MRKLSFAVFVPLVVAACSDQPVAPSNALENAPTLQASQFGDDPGEYDLCDGLSPCDAFDYDRDGVGGPDGLTGVPGFCFLPPTVDNHLSDPACSAPLVPGLSGLFKLAWCQVFYGPGGGTTAPTIGDCQDPADWKDLVEDGGFYSTSVRWRRNEASVGDVFRLYVVNGSQMFAHRDVVIDPNLTTPADGYVHSIGFGNEPIKVKITEAFECAYFDTQGADDNAATCLIAGDTDFSFETEFARVDFRFPDGNPAFLGTAEVSNCLPLGFDADELGNVSGTKVLVDTPLADCKFSFGSEDVSEIAIPAEVEVTVLDPRWVGGDPSHPFENAFAGGRLNVLHDGPDGVRAMAPALSDPPTSWANWMTANPEGFVFRALDWGLEKLAWLIGPEPLAAVWPSNTYSLSRWSDFQISLQALLEHDMAGSSCDAPHPSCLDLGGFPTGTTVPVSVHATAPDRVGPGFYDVPGVRVHVWPQTGSVACPATPVPNQQCYDMGEADNSTVPPSYWPNLVIITGDGGDAVVDWTLDPGDNTLLVNACGVARRGPNEPNPPSEPGADDTWGDLIPEGCNDRAAALTNASAYDNGPADGDFPFEPTDFHEVAIYGLPLTFEATTCPEIDVNGTKGDGEWVCAQQTGFTVNLPGPKPSGPNAWLYAYSDGSSLFLGLEVAGTNLGNKVFFNIVEPSLTRAAGDDLLLMDFGLGTVEDWHFTQACVGNNSNSLCGAKDTADDGASGFWAVASATGANGHTFYEFERPYPTGSSGPGAGKQDLGATSGQTIGIRVQRTQGQGGGQGGFEYPSGTGTYVTYTLP